MNELLVSFALKELPQQQSCEVEAHLTECKQCRRDLDRLKALLESAGQRQRLSADSQMCQSAKQAVLQKVRSDDMEQPTGGIAGLEYAWRTIMSSRAIKLAAAAVIVVAILGVLTLGPGGPGNGKWWLVPSAAAKEITDSLDKIEALVYRQQFVFVRPYGSTHVSGNWQKCYQARDMSRKDTYYDDELVGIQYNLPDGNDTTRYDVSFEYQCYTVEQYEGGARGRDPVELLRFYVGLLDKADRVLGTEIFEGRKCVGFEISAGKYGDNPKEWTDRIWFDVETKLPVRIEKHGRPVTDHPEQTFTFIQDQFEYYVQLPVDMFAPQIPEGFANTHPDNIRAQREKQEKGEMLFAEVPPGLKDEIVAALKGVKTAVYRQGATAVFLSRYAWRKDIYDGRDQLRRTEWFVIEKEDMAKTSWDFNDKDYRLTQTIVDFEDRTYTTIVHRGDSCPGHPMDRILFLAGWIDRADCLLENAEIDGVECFGLELSAKKYGSNPDGMLDRMWFDVQRKLPAKMEGELPRADGTKAVIVKDQFEWNAELPAEIFVPEIPPGFTFVEPAEM
jgi:hypothetical protein